MIAIGTAMALVGPVVALAALASRFLLTASYEVVVAAPAGAVEVFTDDRCQKSHRPGAASSDRPIAVGPVSRDRLLIIVPYMEQGFGRVEIEVRRTGLPGRPVLRFQATGGEPFAPLGFLALDANGPRAVSRSERARCQLAGDLPQLRFQ